MKKNKTNIQKQNTKTLKNFRKKRKTINEFSLAKTVTFFRQKKDSSKRKGTQTFLKTNFIKNFKSNKRTKRKNKEKSRNNLHKGKSCPKNTKVHSRIFKQKK